MLARSVLDYGCHPCWSATMPLQKRADFFEEVERIEQVLTHLLEAESDAFRRMMDAPLGACKGCRAEFVSTRCRWSIGWRILVGDSHGWRLGRLVDPFGLHSEIGHPLVA